MSFSARDLSVVIPTRRRWETIQTTLAALHSQTVAGFETIVVLDGTDQPVPDISGVRLVIQEHAGPGVARNQAVEETERPLILFIGDDMVPAPTFVATHLHRHERDPNSATAVLGKIEWHSAVPRDRLHRWLEWSGALFDYRVLEEQGTEDAGWTRFYSSNVSIKRELFVAAGGFDPDFRFDYEDLDFGWRLGNCGMRLIYERDAVVQHMHPYDWDGVLRRYESRAEAERLMMAKHDWFDPWFFRQVEAAASAPPASRLWSRAVGLAPARPRRVRRAVERRANRYYLQLLAPTFMAAWERCRGRADSLGADTTYLNGRKVHMRHV